MLAATAYLLHESNKRDRTTMLSLGDFRSPVASDYTPDISGTRRAYCEMVTFQIFILILSLNRFSGLWCLQG